MKCALVIPAWVPGEIFSSKTASSQINYWQPVGTLSVAAVLQKAGHFVKFVNGAFLSHEQILAELEQFRPHFIGIYSTTFGWSKARKTAADLKTVRRPVLYLYGRAVSHCCSERCLSEAGTDIDAVDR
jgi:hypothetical protein